MSAQTVETPHPHQRGAYTPTIGSLLGAELLRVRSRRFVKGAVLGLLAVMALVAVINFAQTAKPTAQQITQAQIFCGNATTEGASDESGTPVPGANVQPCDVHKAASVDGAFPKRPALRSDIPAEVLGVGVGVAVLGFVLGCTVGGADWSHKTMTALLFWEPRRARVFLVKLAALLISLTVILAAAVLLWLVVKSILIGVHGVNDVSLGSIVGDTLGYLGRAWLLVLVMGALAYGIASLARNTGAALGVGFVYFAIVELFLNALLPKVAQWTLTMNIGALMTDGGLQPERDGVDHAISAWQGGIVLTAYAVGICLVGLELFRRRDVT